MYQVQKITEDIHWIGGNDFTTERFENLFPIPNGVTYNSYFIDDDRTAVVDAVDSVIRDRFMENIDYLLQGRELSYIIVNHMEPDHCGSLLALADRYPSARIVGNSQTFRFFEQFYHRPMADRYLRVSEKEVLDLGHHKLHVISAPMVHWPEVTVTYDETEQTLFSADCFGSFGALDGNLFADQTDYKSRYLPEARRYYGNIIGKFGMQTGSLLKKLNQISIRILAPLHGPVFRRAAERNLIMDSVARWSDWIPEKKSVLILEASAYGRTAEAAESMAFALSARGICDIKVTDLSRTDFSYAVGDVFQYKGLVMAAPTYNMSLYPPMQHFLEELTALPVRNRIAAVIGNHTWSSAAARIMKAYVQQWKSSELVGECVDIRSSENGSDRKSIENLADSVASRIVRAEE